MAITAENISKHYQLQPGEQWWICNACGRIIARLRGDASLAMKTEQGWRYIHPRPAAYIEAMCTCTDPPCCNRLNMLGGTKSLADNDAHDEAQRPIKTQEV